MINIGDFELKNPFLLAPLAGITDKAMRSLCAEAGASLTYTEMVSGKGLWYGDAGTERLLEVGEDEGPVAFQIFGSEPEIMEQAARRLCTGELMKRGARTPARAPAPAPPPALQAITHAQVRTTMVPMPSIILFP